MRKSSWFESKTFFRITRVKVKIFKGCLPEIVLGPFLTTLTYKNNHIVRSSHKKITDLSLHFTS